MLILLVFAIHVNALAQTVETSAVFLEDSVKIGMPVGYSLTSRYPADKDILFPDSTSNFGRFEYSSKQWYPTITANGFSKDSVIYFVRTFEIDSTQTLALNLIELVDGDSIVHPFPVDSIALVHTISDIPDSLSVIFLQEDTDFARVDTQFNYPFVIASLLMALALLIILWVVFGKKIRNALGARRLKKRNEKFMKEYDLLTRNIRVESIHDDSEIVLSYWKKYMEGLEKLPYRKMTTKEIASMKSEEELINALREVDKVIYADGEILEVQSNLVKLKTYSQDKFEEELNRIQHGVSN